MKLKVLIFAAAITTAPFASAATTLINVDFNAPTPTNTFSGAGVMGTAGDSWTAVIGVGGSNGNYSIAATDLNYSDGTFSGIKVAIGNYSRTGDAASNVDASWASLMRDYLYLGGAGGVTTGTITLSGFSANAQIASLVLYSDVGGGNVSSSFTISGNTLTTSGATGSIGATLTAGDEYVRFNNLLADGTGKVSITWAIANSKAYGVLNGMQIDLTPVPEPATYGLLGAGALAGMAFVRRRRR